MSDLIVGIDLGTTNSVLAVTLEGRIKVIDIHGQPTMPSCVGLDSAGKLIVGNAARNQLIAAPDATVVSIKRKMGEEIRVKLGDKEYSPEEISSFILRELKIEGERQLGQPIKKAVITVPAFFNERQRKATQIAGELAGLEVVRIINEPTAAALAYGAGRTSDETMLVYDLGGGTFDVSVVVVEQGVVEVKASHGDTHLGGDDFDDLLVQRAVREFREKHGVDLSANSAILCRLKVVLERAKCHLSDEPFVSVREEYLDGQHHLEMEISRAEYEEMIALLLEKTLTCIHQSMQDARLIPKDIGKVMLVGGSTRTPIVHRLLHERLQVEPRWEINPDLIVAMGAAIQGAIIAGEKNYSILVDITPHTFGTTTVAVRDGFERLVCAPIIPRNTPLPASKSEVFFTMYDNQDEVKVDARQGESFLPEENSLIGDFLVEGLSPVPAGSPIIIHFDLDLNGMLKVTATEKHTGLAKTVTMDTRGNRALDVDEARRNIASLIGDPAAGVATNGDETADVETEESPEELLASAKDLRKRGEALLTKGLGADDAEEIRKLIHDSAEAIKNRDWAALGGANDTLSDLVFYLED
ncbi:MAG: heat-shock protein Hsp70 [Pedosphaera sp.]|nr:heat-shock protein Hsp70 [Pedosphaera sp.]